MSDKPGFFVKNLTLIIAFLLLCDVGFSFYQYHNQAMDGDLALIALPGKVYTKVLQDPFGISALTDGESYAGINRYFFIL